MVNYQADDIKSFLNISSFEGLKVLYAFSIAKKKKIAFNLKDMAKELQWFSQGNYHFGFIVACASMKIVDYSSHKEILNVITINEILENEIEPKILEISKKHDNDKVDENKWVEEVQRIKDYFVED